MSSGPQLRPDQHNGAVIPTTRPDRAWVVWRLEHKGAPAVALNDLRLGDDGWDDFGGHIWPRAAAEGAGAAIEQLAADAPAPPLSPADAKLQAREADARPEATWVIPINKTAKLVVFPIRYDGTPSVMIRRYAYKRSAWNFDSYAIIDRAAAVAIARYLARTA